MKTIKGPDNGPFLNTTRPCCVTDCCQSGCEDCPYDYKNTIDPSIPRELYIGTMDDDQEDS